MSFGASPSDIIIVVTFARKLYRQCKNAGGEYLEISREVRSLHTVLKHIKIEVEAEGSVLNRDDALYARELAPIIGNCDFTLRQLDELLQKYGRLASRENSSAGGRLWDKIRFGSNEMDELGSIRMKLINHKTNITVFLDTIQLHESGRVSLVLDNQGGQLDVILDKVDTIARRMGQRADSMMTTYPDDDKEVWKEFRRELVKEGFSSDVLTQHKDVLRAYIREIEQNGQLLEETPDPESATSPGVDPERWLEDVALPAKASRTEQLPTFESLHLNPENTSTKEVVKSEENMKFPQSIKAERLKPEAGPSSQPSSQPSSPTVDDDDKKQPRVIQDRTVERKETVAGPSPLLPKLVTAIPESKTQVISYPAAIMSTTDLMNRIAYNFDGPSGENRPRSSQDNKDHNNAVCSSPIDPKSSSSSIEERVPRSMAVRPKALVPESAQRGISPSQLGTSPASSRSAYGSSPRSSILEPDSHGNAIPLDAKWTRVRRSLISTEVLDQDKRRYEARPDFVAILGVLSREEIEEYATRSTAIREARHHRQGGPAPRMPPRPIEEQQRRRHVSFDAVNDEGYSPDYSDDERDHRGSPGRERRSYPSTNPPIHPGPLHYASASPTHDRFVQPLPQFNLSPQYQASQPRSVPQFPSPMSPYVPLHHQYSASSPPGSQYGPSSPMWIPAQASPPQYYLAPVEHPPMSRSPRGSSSSRSRNLDKELEREKKKRWTSNLTAAGIGGAAVSLLSVLSEAAENL